MQAWESFIKTLEIDLGDETTNKWLRPLKVIDFDACNLYLEAENNFQIEWFEEHVRLKAKKEFRNNNFRSIKIHLTCPNEQTAPIQARPVKKTTETPSFSLIRDSLNPIYTAENFIFNKANALLSKLISQVQEISFNPLFLYGGPSTGKTHLLNAFGLSFEEHGASVLYVKTETFTQNVIQAIRSGNMQEFRKAYRHVDVFIMDDVQDLAKKNATQEEFFHTFNALQSAGTQIILSANCPPSQLKEIEPRLVSRFEWGLSLPIAKLEQEDLLLLAKKQATELDLPLEESHLEFLLEKFGASPQSLQRSLEAVCLRVRPKQTINIQTLSLLLKDLLDDEEKTILTKEQILHCVSKEYQVKPEEILGKSQTLEHVLPRQIAMFLCRKELQIPFIKLGQYFNRDHSTVMSSVKLIDERIKNGNEEISYAIHSIKESYKK